MYKTQCDKAVGGVRCASHTIESLPFFFSLVVFRSITARTRDPRDIPVTYQAHTSFLQIRSYTLRSAATTFAGRTVTNNNALLVANSSRRSFVVHRLVSHLIRCHERPMSTIKTPTITSPVISSANQRLFYCVLCDAVLIHAVSNLPILSYGLFAASFCTLPVLDQCTSIIFLRMSHPNINEG
jgi:hypothetical protein